MGRTWFYRKLEQNVCAFKEGEHKPGDAASPSIADQLGLMGDDRKRVGAMIVGRFENGTPLSRASRDSLDSVLLAGQPGGTNDPTCHWPRRWGGPETTALPFGSFVRLKAGEYFFAPSPSFLKELGSSPPVG